MASKLLVVIAILVPFGLVACGDDDDEETPAAGGEGGEQTVAVSETDFAIDPANPTVQAGTVTFEVTNDGQAPHNLEVEGEGIEEELEADLEAGESGTLTVELQPGTYEWYCPVGNHAEMGMEGELTVEEAGGSAGGAGESAAEDSGSAY